MEILSNVSRKRDVHNPVAADQIVRRLEYEKSMGIVHRWPEPLEPVQEPLKRVLEVQGQGWRQPLSVFIAVIALLRVFLDVQIDTFARMIYVIVGLAIIQFCYNSIFSTTF